VEGVFNFRALSFIGRSKSTRLTVSTTRKSSIAPQVVLLLPRTPFGRNTPHCTPIAKQRKPLCRELKPRGAAMKYLYPKKNKMMFQPE
jgi:hypothetical protein